MQTTVLNQSRPVVQSAIRSAAPSMAAASAATPAASDLIASFTREHDRLPTEAEMVVLLETMGWTLDLGVGDRGEAVLTFRGRRYIRIRESSRAMALG